MSLRSMIRCCSTGHTRCITRIPIPTVYRSFSSQKNKTIDQHDTRTNIQSSDQYTDPSTKPSATSTQSQSTIQSQPKPAHQSNKESSNHATDQQTKPSN